MAEVSTLCGNGVPAFSGGSAASARFKSPSGITFDKQGHHLIVTDTGNHCIIQVTVGGDVSLYAGNGGVGISDGCGASAQFNCPNGSVAFDGKDNFFFTDTENHRICKVTPGHEVTTIAGSGVRGCADGLGTAAQFNYPAGIAVDGDGNCFVTDWWNHRIRKIAPNGYVTTYAGSGDAGFADGSATTAQFNRPSGITIDEAGNLFVTDLLNHRIRMIDGDGNVTTVAGTDTSGVTDGSVRIAQFSFPTGITIDGGGNLIVADCGNHRIRMVRCGGDVTTIAGTLPGFVDGTDAMFNSPVAVTVDNEGNLFVADANNHCIRVIPGAAAPAMPRIMPAAEDAGGVGTAVTINAAAVSSGAGAAAAVSSGAGTAVTPTPPPSLGGSSSSSSDDDDDDDN